MGYGCTHNIKVILYVLFCDTKVLFYVVCLPKLILRCNSVLFQSFYSLTTKKQRTKFSSENFQKMLSPNHIT